MMMPARTMARGDHIKTKEKGEKEKDYQKLFAYRLNVYVGFRFAFFLPVLQSVPCVVI
jgi:hypothetical protein